MKVLPSNVAGFSFLLHWVTITCGGGRIKSAIDCNREIGTGSTSSRAMWVRQSVAGRILMMGVDSPTFVGSAPSFCTAWK